MKKTMKTLTIMLILLSAAFQAGAEGRNFAIAASSSDLSKADAYKAIVKIKSLALNDDNELTHFSSGSGVIIDPRGIVLTNQHVVTLEDDFDGTEMDASYIVCLTEATDKEPECKYSGKLIASSEDYDVALLKIESISGYSSKSVFPFLDLNSSDSTAINDEVTALGYPAIGGDTVTITSGVISGKESKYDKNWIKTDAIISYGSSGGAAIDADAGIIGITSGAHSDTLGSLGYIISAASINSWIGSNLGKTPKTNSVTSATVEMAKKALNLAASNEFINSAPGFKITKPSDWDFTFEDETGLMIDKGSDDEGGYISISYETFPYAVDTGIVEASIKRSLSFLISMASIIKNEDAAVNGAKAKKVIISAAGEQQNHYFIPAGNRLISILYDYGNDDKDKTIIDGIINSFAMVSSSRYAEKTEYVNGNPQFNVKLGENWVLLARNSKAHPLFIANKDNQSAFVDFQVQKTDDNTKNLNNEEYLSQIEQTFKEGNSLALSYDIRNEIVAKNAHYKLNGSLSDVIMMDTVDKSISTGAILAQNRSYYIKTGDKYIVASLNYYKGDASGYGDISGKFEKMLSAFALGTTQPAAVSDDSGSSGASGAVPASQAASISNASMYKSLKGKIMLKVESNGEAYYIHPSNQKMYYLGRPLDAFAVMREQGVGITSANLSKIPVGLDNLTGVDADSDGLPDAFEDAFGTDKRKADTDGDGYKDKVELSGGYNPNGAGKLNFDANFSGAQKGKILLQVERSGEAWYVNPADGKRYFLGRPADAFQVMRNLGLGISNSNFAKL